MKKFIDCFKKYSLFFILWLVVAIILVLYEFSLLTKVPENKKIDILVNATSLNEESFSKILNDNKPDYLKEINYRYNDANNDMFNSVLQTYGDVYADMYILSDDILDKFEDLSKYFYKLDEDICNNIISNDITYYKNKNNEAYGILLDNECLKEEGKTFYILFANDSLHLGKLNNQEEDGAITICKALLNK